MSQKTTILADMRGNLAPQRPYGNTQGVLGTSGDIARRTGISQHDVTHALYDMQKQGILSFKPSGKKDSPGDGKGALTHLRLTQKGLNFPLTNGEATPEPEPPKVQAGPVADVEGYLEDRSGYHEARRNTLQATVEGVVAALDEWVESQGAQDILAKAALQEAAASVALDGETRVVEALDPGIVAVHERSHKDGVASRACPICIEENIPGTVAFDPERHTKCEAVHPLFGRCSREPHTESTSHSNVSGAWGGEHVVGYTPTGEALLSSSIEDDPKYAVLEGMAAKVSAILSGDLVGRYPLITALLQREDNVVRLYQAAALLRGAKEDALADMVMEQANFVPSPLEEEVTSLIGLLMSEED